MRRRNRRVDHSRICIVRGCGLPVAGWQWLCGRCFRVLPFARRKALAEAPPHRRIGEARDAASFLEANSPAAVAARRIGERE